MLFAEIIGWRDTLNPERKIFRSAHVGPISTVCLRYFHVIILRDRELIGGISHLVQFFHVEQDDGERSLFMRRENITLLHENIVRGTSLHNIPRYTAIDLSEITAIYNLLKHANSIQ